VQGAMVIVNILVLLFVASAGSYAGFKNGWRGYEQPDGCVFSDNHRTLCGVHTLDIWGSRGLCIGSLPYS
jgi:hypothetical protein